MTNTVQAMYGVATEWEQHRILRSAVIISNKTPASSPRRGETFHNTVQAIYGVATEWEQHRILRSAVIVKMQQKTASRRDATWKNVRCQMYRLGASATFYFLL